MTLLVYNLLLLAVVVLGLPYWLARMLGSGRYRAGLRQRMGWLPRAAHAITGAAHRERRAVVWLHAVSVGEVLAATRLIAELQTAWPGLEVAVSTTTETGQRLARERFPEAAVFYFPLDFGLLMRRHLALLEPRLVLLMESELWPNLIHECHRRGTPLAVVNARVSDRSFPRYMRLRRLWRPLLREVTVFLAQSEETAARLLAMGVAPERVKVTGNLKYDVRTVGRNLMAEAIKAAAGKRMIVVAGSTAADKIDEEEALLMRRWPSALQATGAMLVMAPRHPDRFAEAHTVMEPFGVVRATELSTRTTTPLTQGVHILLNTIGDLAAVYGVADVAFVGGSLVARGGHNPLEAARFGVPVLMGPHFENFREIVQKMQRVDGICILDSDHQLDHALNRLLTDRVWANAMGARGQFVFEQQQGATARTVAHLLELVP